MPLCPCYGSRTHISAYTCALLIYRRGITLHTNQEFDRFNTLRPTDVELESAWSVFGSSVKEKVMEGECSGVRVRGGVGVAGSVEANMK